ncbi:5980_t:CDS:2 [Dentiscutata erythropus]|uniref:5980_t:CDS:1 n=1 Tax=Dentiscutata erythropus TaxID=1348616 RepID=A0A9N9DU96_9GLOM|nr:5980_t:CDS:2 [Dentiscutata erythropus]
MKLFETTHTFFYNWSHVSAANWCKYPNEKCPHVIAIDVLDRHVDPETGILRTERLITCQQNVPRLLSRLYGGNTVIYAREVSEIDPKNKVLRMTSCNLSMNNLINVSETVTYTEDPSDSSKTLFKQEARIKCGESISRFANYIEDFFVQRFRDNAAMGKQGFENVLDRLTGQGETLLLHKKV